MSLDQITKSLVREFLDESNTKSRNQESDFERFVTHVIVSPHIAAAIDFENVVAGAGGDTGLDAIAIVVNGELITDPDDINFKIKSGTTLDVHFIFIQASTSTSFSTSKIGTIEYGVKDFFSDNPTLRRNDTVQAAAEISNLIFNNANLFRNANPSCSVFYVTAGRWQGDADLASRMKAAENDIDSLNLFSAVSFKLLDAREIQKRYRSLRNGIEREFVFTSSVAFPEIDQIAEAHIGYIAATDLITLIDDGEGGISSALFYDNVRDFQGDTNPVNAEIANTLDGESRKRFALMNNGITIIAKSVRRVGSKFMIKDFQVVNGCQTCNVLWSKRQSLDSKVLVPLRLISTDSEDVFIDIIRATNRQTEVKEEQFYATGEYLKQLEMFFESAPTERRLYLERRAKQYASASVERTRIVPFNSLVRSFASLVLKEPHRATRNYKQILERIPNDLLNPDHRPSIYLAAASSLYRLEYLFRNSILNRQYSSAKYHLLLASRLVHNSPLPKTLNGSDADRWAQRLLELYWDQQASERVFLQAAEDIKMLVEGNLSRDRIRTQPFTTQLLKHYGIT